MGQSRREGALCGKFLVACLLCSCSRVVFGQSEWEPYYGDITVEYNPGSRLGFYDCWLYPGPGFSGGILHLKVGESETVYEYRSIRHTIWPFEIIDEEPLTYYYQPTSPGGGQNWESTATPRLRRHTVDFQGIPGGGDPYPDLSFWADICIVQGLVTVPVTIPRKEGDPAVTIQYSLLPAGINFDHTKVNPIVIELSDPGHGGFKYRHSLAAWTGTGSFSWDGKLYDETNPAISSYCWASAVLARMDVYVEDLYFDETGSPYLEPWDLVFFPPALSVFSLDGKTFGNDRRYLGQKLNYCCATQGQLTGSIQWSGGGKPPSGTGGFFATQYFSGEPSQRTITVSAVLDGVNYQVQWPLEVRDFLCLTNEFDGGSYEFRNEYNGIFQNNPPFGAYASALATADGWDTDFVILGTDGRPEAGAFNPFWLWLYYGTLNGKAGNLRNSKYQTIVNQVQEISPWNEPGNVGLGELNWKGYSAPVVVSREYLEANLATGNSRLKGRNVNCFGESIHGYTGKLGWATSGNVETELNGPGRLFSKYPDQILREYEFQGGDIILFKQGQNVQHSARVISGGTWEGTSIWACNAGIAEVTKGFAEIALSEYLNYHQCEIVDVLRLEYWEGG